MKKDFVHSEVNGRQLVRKEKKNKPKERKIKRTKKRKERKKQRENRKKKRYEVGKFNKKVKERKGQGNGQEKKTREQNNKKQKTNLSSNSSSLRFFFNLFLDPSPTPVSDINIIRGKTSPHLLFVIWILNRLVLDESIKPNRKHIDKIFPWIISAMKAPQM